MLDCADSGQGEAVPPQHQSVPAVREGRQRRGHDLRRCHRRRVHERPQRTPHRLLSRALRGVAGTAHAPVSGLRCARLGEPAPRTTRRASGISRRAKLLALARRPEMDPRPEPLREPVLGSILAAVSSDPRARGEGEGQLTPRLGNNLVIVARACHIDHALTARLRWRSERPRRTERCAPAGPRARPSRERPPLSCSELPPYTGRGDATLVPNTTRPPRGSGFFRFGCTSVPGGLRSGHGS